MVSLEPVTNSPGALARSAAPNAGRRLGLPCRPGRLTSEESRLYQAIPDDVQYVPHPSFGLRETEERLFGEGVEVVVPRWQYYKESAKGVLNSSPTKHCLTPPEEAILFLRYNYARYRLSLLADAQGRQYGDRRAREMVGWFRRIQDARADLVQANLGLVLAMAKRSPRAGVEFGELISEGNLALLRSVEKFDVSRGYRFSTYACRAILKSFGRLACKRARYRQRFPTEFDPRLERSDYDARRHEIQARDSIEALRDVLARNRARLTDIEQTIVWERFAFAEGGKKRTLAEVGRVVGLSNERVRQIQSLALQKIRAAMEEDPPRAA